ncbi:MAG: DNA internalization-related competence protein ComEC/Rec2 [Acidobacteria bacterium]|nr:DNA internalization-related competence protein ComEC/Rec2 [Acidobacteriota bacterium]
MRVIAAIPAVGLLAGSAAGLLEPERAWLPGWLLLCAAALAAVWARRAARPRAFAAAMSLAFAGGAVPLAADAWQRAWRPPLRAIFEALARVERRDALADGRAPPLDDRVFAVVEGVLRADASPGGEGTSLSVLVDRVERPAVPRAPRAPAGAVAPGEGLSAPHVPLGGIAATVGGRIGAGKILEWRAGRRVRLPVQLHRPARYLDPGVPDFERALARRGTTLVGTVKSPALVEVIAPGSALDEFLAAARAYSRHAISTAVGRWSPRSASIVAAIVIGDRAGLDDAVQRRLQEAGTYHVIAISGGNIAILAGLLLGALRLAGATGPGAMVVAMAALLAYGRLVGGGASVDRATLMACVYLAARALDHRTAPLNALAVVAGAMIIADPLAVGDPAFLLTLGATLAILAVLPALPAARLPRAAAVLLSILAASAATEALLFPVGAFAFSRVTFAGLALNFLAIPLMTLAQVAGMAAIPAFAMSVRLAAAAGWLAHAGADGLVASADLVRFAPALSWRVAAPNPLVVAGYYLSLASAWHLWRQAAALGSGETRGARRWRRRAAAAAAGCAIWILAEPWTLYASRGDGRLHVAVLDVAQGDAVFVRFPAGRTMLVDAGGLGGRVSFDIGDRVVAPVLRESGVRRLDALVLTHGDPDHIGGASALMAEFRPRRILEGVPVPGSSALARLRAQAAAMGLEWSAVRRGQHTAIDGVDVRVLHPPAPDWERQRVRNDDSIVLEIVWRGVSVLLTGDLGRDAEQELPPLAQARLRAVKVAHHGSPTSSGEAFVRAAGPAVAIASAGRANPYGHPAAAVVRRFEEAGARVFRTDRDGMVAIETDGESIDVRTFVNPGVVHHEVAKDTEHTERRERPDGVAR